jgi:hypothetical protein
MGTLLAVCPVKGTCCPAYPVNGEVWQTPSWNKTDALFRSNQLYRLPNIWPWSGG